MNGKVSGRVFLGNSPLPVEISNNDLHSYVVANDGRAYVAISNIPDSLGPSLQPLSSLGGVIGWAFALEQPGYQNGFSLIGKWTCCHFYLIFNCCLQLILLPQIRQNINSCCFKYAVNHEHSTLYKKHLFLRFLYVNLFGFQGKLYILSHCAFFYLTEVHKN